MRSKPFLLVLTIFILGLMLAGCGGANGSEQAANLADPVEADENLPAAPAETDAENQPEEEEASVLAPDEQVDLVEFTSADGVFTILFPQGWATNQVPLENGLSFGIAPLAEHFDAGPAMFDQAVIMVYGSVQQVSADLAFRENLENFHISTFYGGNTPFSYVLTHWMLGTALADQTVVSFAVGVPDHSMALYGQLAQQMFNSVLIDTEVTAQLAD